ncbi:helix-turn-helix transcriptional regulator [Hydrogenophaga laconesensis]|uniref:helix-turn-helix transcriptional regulator n=1 Tax=Hydrogenophaga laconesensis TaxID=1805971 RepID=UPI00286CDC3F|nr:helix-turn-helix transcriptional regulator [Hydrogenophaga laconesensis]
MRDDAGITQARLAAKLGQQQSYVAKVEKLERRLDVLEYVHWLRALDVDPSDSLKRLVAEARQPRARSVGD